MLKSNENINGVTLNDFLGSLGAKDRATAEANLIKVLMDIKIVLMVWWI